MKGNFEVLKYRYYAIGFSCLFILVGIVFAIIFGGFNTGIDFGSGFSERVQIAPIGMKISYEGELSVTAGVSENNLYLEFRGTDGVNRIDFPSSLYQTVDELATALKKNGITVSVFDGSLKVENFMPGYNFPARLSASDLRLNYATDTKDVDIDDVRDALSSLESVNVQTLGKASDGGFQIRIKAHDGDSQDSLEEKVNSALGMYFGEDNIVLLQSDFVGPKFSANLLRSSFYAILLAIALILVYIAFRFRLSYALSSILALFHDVVMMFAFILIFRLEVSSTTIAAVLTIIGYSLNNTIVIFDRIRENLVLKNKMSLVDIVNLSIRQSFSRTLITSLTTLFAILPLAIFSSGDIKNFAINLTWGVVIGTYSSNFLAPAFLMMFHHFSAIDKEKKKIESDPLLEG